MHMAATDAPGRPQLTIVIPTRNRPALVEGAVESALCQTLQEVEVIVIDDASIPAVNLPPRPRLCVVRLPSHRGLPAARNAGLAHASGRWITFLDDDDRLLPHMAEVSLAAIAASTLPPPVAVVSAMEVVGPEGTTLDRRIPPTFPRGCCFPFETAPPGRSLMTKNTLVVDRDLLRSIGGFDPDLDGREQSDLFLRLNPICSIIGLQEVTYRLDRSPGPRASRNPLTREIAFSRLLQKHRDLFDAHPAAHAEALLGHARMALASGPRRSVLPSVLRAVRVAPRHTLGIVLDPRRLVTLVRTWRFGG